MREDGTMTEIEEITFDDLELSAAVMYATARRFCIIYETIELPDEDRSTDNLMSAGHRLMEATEKWHEALIRWGKASTGEGVPREEQDDADREEDGGTE